MSFIIDVSRQKYFSTFGKIKNIQKVSFYRKREEQSIKQNSFSLIETIQKNLRYQHSGYQNNFISPCLSKITLENQINLSEGKGLIKYHINDTNKSITIQIDILNKQSNYLIIDNLEKRNLLNKMIMIKSHVFDNNLFKVNFNLNSGKITLWLPLFYFFQGKQFQRESESKRIVIFNKLISCVDQQTKNIMKFLSQLIFQNKKLEQYSTHNKYPIFYKKQIKKLFKLNQISNVYTRNFNRAQIISQHTLRQEELKQIQSKQYLISNNYQISRNFVTLNSLFLNIYPYVDDIKTKDKCDLTHDDNNKLKLQLCVPQRLKSRSKESVSLLSDIYITNIQQIKLVPINKGGFSQIYWTQLKYYHPNNINQSKNNKINKQHQHKDIFIIKRQTFKNGIIQSKNSHQYEIIKHMRNSTSIMINRYYCPLNNGSILKNDLIMDRMSFNLRQFISFHTKSLSLQTKLYFFLNIIQCVRSINAYNVVHLDLKPSNLMLNQQLVIKLIDFGQSYHPKLLNLKFFNPGFTMPYSCPQVHQTSKDFTIKSDVYSLGILLYQMIYKKFPFYIYDDRLVIEKYTQKQYMNYWFYNYQQIQTYGQNLVYLIIDQLIFKCVHQQPSKRPELHMLALITRQCINILS